MKMIRIFFVVAVIFSGCLEKKSKVQKQNQFHLKFVSQIEFEDISSINRIISKEKHIYIADWNNNHIYKIDNDDVIVNSFGGVGKGPGEFSKLTDIAIDKNSFIYASDQNMNRVQVFDENGSFVKSLKTDYSNVGIGLKGENLLVNSLSPEYAIYEYNQMGNLINQFVELDKGQDNFLDMLKNISRFVTFDDVTYRISYNSPSIYAIKDSIMSLEFTNNTIDSYNHISFIKEGSEAKLNRGSIVHSDIIVEKDFIYVVGGGGNNDVPNNKLPHFFNIYNQKWEIMASLYPENLPYSQEGYTICKTGNIVYFGLINGNSVYKFHLVNK